MGRGLRKKLRRRELGRGVDRAAVLCCLRRRAAIHAAASQGCRGQGRKMFPRKCLFAWLRVRIGGFCGDLLRMTETDPLAVDCRSPSPSPLTMMPAIHILRDA